jgi:uncharacterized membrane protein YdjX (TVP38/TMEM64 family)
MGTMHLRTMAVALIIAAAVVLFFAFDLDRYLSLGYLKQSHDALAGGAIFRLGVGTLIFSLASSVGALLAFLAARFVLRDSVRARFKQRAADMCRARTASWVSPSSASMRAICWPSTFWR